MKCITLPCKNTDIGVILYFHHTRKDKKFLLIFTYNKILYYCLNNHAHTFTYIPPSMIDFGNVNNITACINHQYGICYIYQYTNNSWIKYNIHDGTWDDMYYTHSSNHTNIIVCDTFNHNKSCISGVLMQTSSDSNKYRYRLFNLYTSEIPRLHIESNLLSNYSPYVYGSGYYRNKMFILRKYAVDISKIHILNSLIMSWQHDNFYVFFLFNQILYFVKLFGGNLVVHCYDLMQPNILYQNVGTIIPHYSESNTSIKSIFKNDSQELCVVIIIKQHYHMTQQNHCQLAIETYGFGDMIPYEIRVFKKVIVKRIIESFFNEHFHDCKLHYRVLLSKLVLEFYPLFC